MVPQCGHRISKPQLYSLVFHHTVILLLLMDFRTGQTQTVSPSQTIITLVGEDIMLPCHLEPPSDAVSESVEWGRLDLDPRFVHVWYDGQNHLVNQNPSYKGRTSLSTEKLKQGDLSLKLSRVKHSDNGRYRCYFPSGRKESVVELIVGSLSSPTIAGININRSAVALQCESAGWYPEPELLWLDSDRNLLSAGPSETLRGPDGLYTVSSRVTVEKRHSNNITCGVQQKNISQSRETHIHVSGDCVAVPPSSAVSVSIILAMCLIFTCAAATVVWKWRQNKSKETKWHTEHEAEEKEKEQLMAEREISEELQQKEEELKDVEVMINILMEQENGLQKMKEEFKHQWEILNGEQEDIDKELQSVAKNTESDREKGYWALKEMIHRSRNKLIEKKQTHAELQTNTEKLLLRTQKAFNKMKDKKTEGKRQKEKISLQIAEMQKQKDEIQEKSHLEQNQETLNI